MLLNALASDSPGLASPARRESLRLLTTLCASHPDAATPHFHKALAHLARRLKDPASDTSMHDVCRHAAGQLAAVYLRPLAASGVAETGNATATLFMKPLFEVMGEQSKVVQVGAAVCLAKTVEGAVPGPGVIGMFGKLGPRICKLLGGQGVQAKELLGARCLMKLLERKRIPCCVNHHPEPVRRIASTTLPRLCPVGWNHLRVSDHDLKRSVKLHVLNLFDELLQQHRHHHALLDGIISVHNFKRSGDSLLDPPTRPLGRVIGSAKCPARCGGPSHSEVFYLYAIKKVGRYLYAMKKFVDTCVPSPELPFTSMPFRPLSELTVSNRGVK
jgi:hypothetical protein